MTGKEHGTRLVVLPVILAVVAVAGIFFYTVGAPIVLMAVQQAREASRRRQVENNLKQLGLALQSYHQSHSAQQGETANTYTNPVGETPIQMGDPFVLQHGGRYYLFGTNASNDGFKCLESTDLVHWTPKGWAYQETEGSWAKSHYWAPEVKEYRGKFYMTYSAMPKKADTPRLLIALAVSDKPEGPYTDLHAPWFDFGYSANHTGFPHYGIGYGTADKPLGPWVKAEENPIAATNLDIGVSGPGHNSITRSPDGKEMFIVYHSHADPKKPSGERVVNIDRLQFDQDGKLKIKGPTRRPQPMPSGATDIPTDESESPPPESR